MRSTKTFLVCLMLIWTVSCATGGECSWAKQIVTSKDDVMIRATKEQIVAHNRKVSAFCR